MFGRGEEGRDLRLGGERSLGGFLLIVLLLAIGVAIGGCLSSSQVDTESADKGRHEGDPAGTDLAGENPPAEGDPAAPGPAEQRPNILFILTDDQDAGSVSEMRNVRSLLATKGTSFSRAFVTTAMCCPSRASLLRGQYAHNHGIRGNELPDGGFGRFEELGHEGSTVATWLDGAGYHTGYMGKYLNEYGTFEEPNRHVPPGWDTWIGYEGGYNEERTHDAFRVNFDGKLLRKDADTRNSTDYLAHQAEIYIKSRKPDDPWFLAVATNAPHGPALASGRNDDTYAGRTMPKSPSFNEADVSDKAALWRRNPHLTNEECPRGYRDDPTFQCLEEVDEAWRDRMESLQDVDDMVGRLVGALRDKDLLRNTYVVYTSDNGYQTYDNRIYSKGAPYEGSHEVPMIVRGPGVGAGRTDGHLVANIDLAPTFARWARARTPAFVDGRSLVPVLEDPRAPWRTRLLYEHRLGRYAYDAVRTSEDEVYIEYPLTNETEYYDLKTDPHQLDGKAKAPPPELETQLRALADCADTRCRSADGGP